MNVLDADAVARAAGVSRRTVISRAARLGGVVYLGNKAFVLPAAAEKLYAPSVANAPIPVRGKHMTLQQAADALGCSRSTILRVLERTGLGERVGRRRYLPEYQLRQVKKNILAQGVTRLHSDKKAMSEHGKRMARSRWG
jgi:excisionase family DNA binding protein